MTRALRHSNNSRLIPMQVWLAGVISRETLIECVALEKQHGDERITQWAYAIELSCENRFQGRPIFAFTRHICSYLAARLGLACR